MTLTTPESVDDNVEQTPPARPARAAGERPARPAGERPARPAGERAAGAAADRPARRPRPTKRRAEGQWALGYREPLNPNEQSKKDDNPLNVRARIENIYSKVGFDGIDKADLRGRFRWWGLYTQREQGYDGTFTGDENVDLLEASYFMMRIRCDGGALTTAQLRTLGELSTEFARDTADLSDRENVQYHWIRVENVPTIWERIEAVGLKTTEACGDCPRVVLGSPLAGDSVDEVLDPTPAIDEIVRRYIGDPKYSNLPRKFKTAISGLQDVAHEINDVAFIGVEHPEHGPGLDLWVGGGLSTNPMLAQRVGVWVPLDEVPDVWEAVVSVFRDYGYRRLRTKARLKFLIKDWGIEKFRQVLEDEYLKRKLIDGPAPAALAHPIDHVGVTRQKNGLNAVGFSQDIAGRVSGTILQKVADAAELVGSDRIRFSPYQKLIVLDVPDDQVDGLIAELGKVGLQGRPSNWRRNLMACSGIEFCKLSFTETRKRSQALVPELEQRLADINEALDVPITVNINGCPNSCARSQIADIGFKGQLIDDEDGNHSEGFQVHLGGSLGLDSGFGRKLRQHKVATGELGDYIERVVRQFVENREDGERFAQWAVRADEELLPMTATLHTDELRGIAERGAADLGPDATADELLRWTAETFGTDFLIAANMQDAVLIDVADKAIRQAPGAGDHRLKVLFLDTGYHFAETIGTRDAVTQVYDLDLLNVVPEHTVAQQDELLGKDLFARDPAECCRLRKVVPLRAALAGFPAWVTGIRRVEAPTRANAPLISFDEGFGLVKINPLAAWSDEEFATYIETHGVLVNPLVDEGYPSIGCAPCTVKPAIGADPRSGRWAGRAKTECGLHVS